MLQAARALGRHILATVVDMRLNHHTSDGTVAGEELLANAVDDLGLVCVVLVGVAI